MFCGLLGGKKFSKKCKLAVKLTEVRIEQIKKKKQAVVRIDKKDVAGFVAGCREDNAFKRMDKLIDEMNLVSCYEMIEKFCNCIVDQLPTLQKTKDCPEEAMEAVSTLIFAAARFHGLPELRDLRSLFAKREWKCMESSVNPEFAEKTRKKAFSREKKLELMKNIADEFNRPKEIVLPQHEEINDVVQKHQVELEATDIHVISTAKTRDSFDPDDIEAHRGRKFVEPQSMAEDQHELDCSAVEKRVVPVEILNAKPVNGRALPCTKADAIDRIGGKVEDQLNKNTRGRYVNPPYLIHPKTSDTTNKVGVSQIEKPMPLSVGRKGKEPITDTKDDAVSINKPAKAKVTPQRAFLLPSESVSTAEAKQTHVRGKSLQLDPSRPNRSRVHPRLPDYDQLVAKFSALKYG